MDDRCFTPLARRTYGEAVPALARSLEPEHRVIEIVAAGVMSDPKVTDLIEEALTLLRDTGITDVLVDASAMTHEVSYTRIVELATELAALGIPSDWRQAIVRPDALSTAVAVSLWEAACNNRGMIAKVFPDRDAALAWLDLAAR